MFEVSNEKIQSFVAACHRVVDYGLVTCSSGNMSYRVNNELALLSASRSWLADITAEQVAVCHIDTGECVNGLTPTCESVFHLGILQRRPEHNVVLHFQSPYATMVACSKKEYDFNVIIEVPVYIGTPSVVEYLPPGSGELADATIEAMSGSDMAILRNHGLVTVGRNYRDALQKASFFELACRIVVSGCDPESLDGDSVKYLNELGSA